MKTLKVVVEVDVTEDMDITEGRLCREVENKLRIGGFYIHKNKMDLMGGAYERPFRVKRLSRAAAAFKVAVERFEKAVVRYAGRGTGHPDDRPVIEEEYYAAKVALLNMRIP